jgi:S1-C subfamily serine protease
MLRHLFCALGLFGLLAFVTANSGWAQNAPPKVSIGIGVETTPKGAQHPGLTIRDVIPDGPGAKAGLQVGDVITKVGDQEVKNYDDFFNSIAKHKPGDKVTLHVFRDGKEQSVAVALGEGQPRRLGAGPFPRSRPAAFLGVHLGELTEETRSRLGRTVQQGALVNDVVPDTPAAKAGLEAGDVITRADNKPVSDPEMLRETIRNAGVGSQITLEVMRGKEKKELKATLEEAPADFALGAPGGRYGLQPPFQGGPTFMQDLQKIPQLERRIEQLEKRVRELEHKSGRSGSKKQEE